MENFYTRTEKTKDEWITPRELTQSLGIFDLDPCQPVSPPWVHARNGFTERDDGLAQAWFGRVWCNPPYGRQTWRWIERLADHGNGIALIPARVGSKGFHNYVFGKAEAVFFFAGRVRFYHVDGSRGGSPNFDPVLVAYGQENVQAIVESGLRGYLVNLQK